ncbi:MAG: DNA methyltransferase [Saprospiraceae bacterium]
MTDNLRELIQVISPDSIQSFFRRKISNYKPIKERLDSSGFDGFSDLTKLGDLHFDNSDELLIFSCRYSGQLSERSSKKKQFEIAKKILKEDFKDGAVFVFYDSSGKFRFSFIRKHYGEQDKKFSSWKRYTYFVDPKSTNKTFIQRIEKCGFNSLDEILEAFSVEALNKQFYLDYQHISRTIIQYIYPGQVADKLAAHQGALNLLNRLMFVYFIQKKKWIMGDPEFISSFWKDYQQHNKSSNSFHTKWLNKIFFKAFNGKAYADREIFSALPESYHTSILTFPYLNGGLFTQDEDTDNFKLLDSHFEIIFEFFQRYNFTIIEDSPNDVELEINPELLGKMYEGMINATDLNDIEAEHGIVYTERPEINFMTRRSFVEVLDKKLKGKYTREFLYHFCFDDPDAKKILLNKYEPDSQLLREIILSITALDPACGSGSMLIGVLQLQVELLKSLFEYEKHPLNAKDEFQLKKQIISESIYGVDVKEWAVRIAELRFWLYMISDAEFSTEELMKGPLLPNLDFKLRQGNSLIQELGNMDFSINALFKDRKRNAGAAKKLNEFIKKKKAFITNQSEGGQSFNQLQSQGVSAFKDFINELIFNNEQLIKQRRSGKQTDLFGKIGIQKSLLSIEQQIEDIQEENKRLFKVLAYIKTHDRIPFSFDIDFMEIFLTKEDPGFDLIVGNPPYVRQEDILPADDALELERLMLSKNKLKKQEVSKAYKEKLSSKVYTTYPFLATKAKTIVDGESKRINIYGQKVPGRSDLYVYFQLICPNLLNSNGTFCFIISNSWLDVDFGGFVQQFLLKHTDIYAVYDCNVRSFSASVNTIIYLHSAIKNQLLPEENYRNLGLSNLPVRFIMNKVDYTEASFAPILIEQEHCGGNTFRQKYRVIVKTHQELWDEGYDQEEFEYKSNKWGGKYLRAPEIYYTILEKGKDILVPLNKIADVRRGITSGANEFFILNQKKADELRIEKKYLKPILKSPKQCKTIEIDSELLDTFIFYCHKNKEQLHNTNTLRYIQWAEKSEIIDGIETRSFHLRPSTRGRQRWYDVGDRKISQTVFPGGFGDTFVFYKNEKVLIDKRLYEVDFYSTSFNESLNSTLTVLFLEVGTRTGLGDGLMDVTVYEAKNIPVVNLEIDLTIKREIKSIFSELGFVRGENIRSQVPNPLPDRKNLDDIIFNRLSLTEEERKEFYWATAELVKQRLDKANSR